jgi:hypothetical protein
MYSKKYLNSMHKIWLDLNSKVVREDIFKPTTGNQILRDFSNDSGVRVIHFVKSKKKNSLSNAQCLHIEKFVTIFWHLLLERFTITLKIFL